ncbi:MerR family transcriptional regulator [Paenibacillus sp. sptzw28]|uniref:MerR family transcriptional regulator n=1 Tax=Paenibacillus sp. sptzw28 TaxID=715179 RepID=UPI001C6EC04E|nr:MerR family transcriptional regulator [Paenibacillus sp. sptzw28]QYR21056.1 MerR family transcriptional regulator [Paenibacillus sp. sptzw28]
MKIGELSRLTTVSIRSIRHYEKKGLLQADRLENDYRSFAESAVDRVMAIQLYLKLGLTADEIGQLFKDEIANPDDYEYCEAMLAMYEEKLSQVDRQIAALQHLKRVLKRQISLTLSKK